MINYLIGNGSKKWRNLSTPCVWEGWWSGTITKMVKEIASWEFPKEQSLVEDKPESGTQKYSKCQTPPIWKKQVAFKWIFRWFYTFWEHIFFLFFCRRWPSLFRIQTNKNLNASGTEAGFARAAHDYLWC